MKCENEIVNSEKYLRSKIIELPFVFIVAY